MLATYCKCLDTNRVLTWAFNLHGIGTVADTEYDTDTVRHVSDYVS